MNILLQGGRLLDPAHQLDQVADLYIADGQIKSIGQAPEGFSPHYTLDCQGKVIMPGLIDLHARITVKGQGATLESEATAAARGGITTLCCPPDGKSLTDNAARVKEIQERAYFHGMARILPLGALTKGLEGEQLSELRTLHQAGCVAFSNGKQPITNTLVLRRAMEYAATHDLTLFLQPQDAWLSKGGCAHEGAVSTRLGLPGIPASAETVDLARALELVAQTGVRLHFSQLSTARAVEMLAEGQARGLPVSGDVAIHQLFLTEMDIGNYNSLCHVTPPLRSQRDRDALRQGVADGTIAAICSDHTPLDHDAKQAPFCETVPGISGLETLLPLAYRLHLEGALGLEQLVTRLTAGPAQILGIDAGEIRTGTSADLIVFDPEAEWVLEATGLSSRGKNTPFIHWPFQGRVTHTLMNGQLCYQE